MQLENGTNVTSADIANINIVTWTATGLVVTLLMVMGCLLNADSGPKDSLLYAKFQVSGWGAWVKGGIDCILIRGTRIIFIRILILMWYDYLSVPCRVGFFPALIKRGDFPVYWARIIIWRCPFFPVVNLFLCRPMLHPQRTIKDLRVPSV